MFPVANTLTVDSIRDCLEGFIPSAIATCALDGTPNVTYVSQVDYVDRDHVALSFQFFNKTRENILANPYATVYVINPLTGQAYRLSLHYLRTENTGLLFERMKVKLAGIAAHSGMTGIFKLQGADIYQVETIERVPVDAMPPPPPRPLLTPLRQACQRLQQCKDMSQLLDETLAQLACGFGIEQSMILLRDERGKRLYTVASHGYAAAGIGWEMQLGEGLIGIAAEQRMPVRIAFKTSEYTYSRAIRQTLTDAGRADELDSEIPFPGLPESESQLAVPIVAGGEMVGVLFVESPQPCRFSYDDEDALVTLCGQLGLLMRDALFAADEPEDINADATPKRSSTSGPAVAVQHYPENDSIFLADEYLIKGVAGAIFWKLVTAYQDSGRDEFSNRELRLDPALGLPDICDNLEARLILLAKRLAERCDYLAIEKTGRGRFRLRVDRPLQLRSGH